MNAPNHIACPRCGLPKSFDAEISLCAGCGSHEVPAGLIPHTELGLVALHLRVQYARLVYWHSRTAVLSSEEFAPVERARTDLRAATEALIALARTEPMELPPSHPLYNEPTPMPVLDGAVGPFVTEPIDFTHSQVVQKEYDEPPHDEPTRVRLYDWLKAGSLGALLGALLVCWLLVPEGGLGLEPRTVIGGLLAGGMGGGIVLGVVAWIARGGVLR